MIRTAEFVSPRHPDKLSDGISDKRHLSFSAVIIETYNIERKSSLKDSTIQYNIYKLHYI